MYVTQGSLGTVTANEREVKEIQLLLTESTHIAWWRTVQAEAAASNFQSL